MIGLLAPLGLAGLAALALPLLIHLLRRPEDRVVLFAAWRYLAEPARPRERLQLRHWLLLALRLLLIAALALLLSQAIWRSQHEAVSATTVLWPGVESAAAPATPDHPVHQLGPDAPASQLRQIDAELPAGAALTVIVPEIVAGLDAERLRLRPELHWKIVPGETPAADQPAPLKISIRGDGADQAESATVQALLQAWQSQGRAIEIEAAAQDVALKPDTGLLFWLGGRPTPAVERWIAQGGRALLSRQADAVASDAIWSIQTQGRGRSVRLAAAFDATRVAALREPQIPAQLAALLLPEPMVDRAASAAVAPLAGAPSGKAPGRSLDTILALIAALLFAAERLWAASLQRR
ncbi:MAG: hypothetical protein JWQ90_4152 [Hydrocarboniphaga sp.]|uniref:BatA domain-containing protein n=1 Tax=Hydrocarboniphaga sp. TaxID=2033016 RepID=UPI00262F30E0|nr:BatA domain-containing protein [Hydrocarboniphaga sp.]MDB5971702.1 hypothetical protein [Hydrocarboniphaga sp.]